METLQPIKIAQQEHGPVFIKHREIYFCCTGEKNRLFYNRVLVKIVFILTIDVLSYSNRRSGKSIHLHDTSQFSKWHNLTELR